jgi:NADPH-dependent 2,4-dienoyl-CoA reductase/sulfur reductase-like enzyme
MHGCRFFIIVALAHIAVASNNVQVVPCDIIVAGGSLASLSAAIFAANSSSRLTVCLTDPTDWPGGQLISSAVPAVDFGPENSNPPNPNLSAQFNEMMDVFGVLNPGTYRTRSSLRL